MTVFLNDWGRSPRCGGLKAVQAQLWSWEVVGWCTWPGADLSCSGVTLRKTKSSTESLLLGYDERHGAGVSLHQVRPPEWDVCGRQQGERSGTLSPPSPPALSLSLEGPMCPRTIGFHHGAPPALPGSQGGAESRCRRLPLLARLWACFPSMLWN